MKPPKAERVWKTRCVTPAGFHQITCSDWGPTLNPRQTIICVHGLSRNGQDFDYLAAELAARGCRVLAPDMVGRHRSDYLAQPQYYTTETYLRDIVCLLAAAGVQGPIDWVGTSMGGLIAMTMASLTNHPIRRLVLNDIGPFLPLAALARIASYSGQNMVQTDYQAVLAYCREIYQPFGVTEPDHWEHLAAVSFANEAGEMAYPTTQGPFRRSYDHNISQAFPKQAQDIDLWPLWDSLHFEKTLVIRGANSDLLTAETAEAMTKRGPKATSLTWENYGHAPNLYEAWQCKIIADFLCD